MQHGETLTYTGKARAKLLRAHVAGEGGETLLVAGSDGRLRTGYLQERRSSPDVAVPADDSFYLVSGAPAELLSDQTLGRAAQFPGHYAELVAARKVSPFLLPGRIEAFVRELSGEQAPTEFDREGFPVRADGDGGLEVYEEGSDDATAATTSTAAPLALRTPTDDDPVILELEAAFGGPFPIDPRPEVGAAGGRWSSIEVAEAMDGHRLHMLPITSLPNGAAAGDTRLEVTPPEGLAVDAGTPWFEPGDRIVIDPGGPAEEFATVDRLGSLVLSAPLTSDHGRGTTVLLRAAQASSGTPGGDPPQPDPDRTIPGPAPEGDPRAPEPDPALPGPGPAPEGSEPVGQRGPGRQEPSEVSLVAPIDRPRELGSTGRSTPARDAAGRPAERVERQASALASTGTTIWTALLFGLLAVSIGGALLRGGTSRARAGGAHQASHRTMERSP